MERDRLVSIVMPAFNSADYIEAAIDSVLAQTWQRWELIIVNDGSTDETRRILRSLSDNRICVVEQTNRGVSAARNAGLSRARGEFVTFLDSDDVLPSRSLEIRAKLLASNPAIGIVDGTIVSKDEKLEKVVRVYSPYYTGPLLPRLLALDDRVFFGTVYMVRRSLLGGLTFPESMSHAEDLLFFTLLADRCRLQYTFVEEEVYHYRIRADSATSNFSGLQAGYLEYMRSVFSTLEVGASQRIRLRLKIAKIMFLTWAGKGDYRNAIESVYQCVFNR